MSAQRKAPAWRTGLDSLRARWNMIPRQIRTAGILIVAIVVLVTYPNWGPGLNSNMPTVPVAVAMLVFIIMALGLNVVVGYAGLLDLGYVAFYAAGAYVAGWFASEQFAGASSSPRSIHLGSTTASVVPGIHISIWILLLAAALFAGLLGVLIGLPTLRLRGDYLAIVTLGFGEIIPQVVRNGDSIFGQNITNGPNGLTPIDSMGFGQELHSIFGFLPISFAAETNSDNWYYWTGLLLVGFTLFCCIRLRDSRLGRAWVAIREDEIAAAAMGVPLMRTKTYAYAIGAFFGGMAGCFFAVYKGSTFPGDFSLNISIFILCMVILGGMGNVWGVCLGGALLAWLNYQGLASIGNTVNGWLGTNWNIPKYEFLIFGIIIVGTMLFRPQGLIPSSRRRAELELGVEGGSLYDASV